MTKRLVSRSPSVLDELVAVAVVGNCWMKRMGDERLMGGLSETVGLLQKKMDALKAAWIWPPHRP